MDLQLNDKKILVVGASSGIGQEVSALLLKEGAELVLTARDLSKLSGFSIHAGRVTILSADLESQRDIEAIIEKVGQLDGIVHSAGIIHPYPIKYTNADILHLVMQVNFFAPALLTSGLLKAGKLNNGASVVFISSVSSLLPYNGSSSYSASKAALEAYSRSLAYESGKKRIRSNAIRAGLVKTPMFEVAKSFHKGKKPEQYSERYLLGFGQVDNVADLVAFLLSDRSSWINGAVLNIDGGFSIG